MAPKDVIVVDFIDQLIRQLAAEQPDGAAVIFEGRTQTYSGLNAASSRAANAFLALGVQQGDRIVWIAQNLPQFWEALFGASKIGAVLTPVNWRLAPAEIAQIVEDSGAKILIAEKQFLDALGPIADLSAMTCLEVDTGAADGFDARAAAASDAEPAYKATPDDDFIQLYTSGTTGLPKGVMLPQRCYAELGSIGAEMKLICPRSEEEVAIHALPHFHVAGVNFGLMAMARSMPVIQMRGFDPGAMVDIAAGDRPVNAFLVPAMIMMILNAAKEKGVALTNFANVSYGAAPMPEPLLDAAMTMMPNACFTQFYGATETTGALTTLAHEDHARGLPQRRSAGKHLPGGEVRIVDPATGDDVAQGETGEIHTKSGYLMDGYWRRKDATDDVLKDGWYATGDAGIMDENGFLYVVDRIKDMIISGGENIYPAELENILAKHPDIAEVAVVGAPDEKWGEVVKACVVCKPGTKLDESAIMACLEGKIASFKMPRQIAFMAALPRNPSGKVLKKDLRASG